MSIKSLLQKADKSGKKRNYYYYRIATTNKNFNPIDQSELFLL
mgnify:CR=1 FL=1